VVSLTISFQFAVSKQVRNGRTFTQIPRLTGDAHTEEIARVLGGKDLTNITLHYTTKLFKNKNCN